jgi:hypothetical protein
LNAGIHVVKMVRPRSSQKVSVPVGINSNLDAHARIAKLDIFEINSIGIA